MRVHKVSVAVSIFIVLFAIIHIIKPALLYTPEGGFRQFGVGYKHKTIVPIWIVAILLAILSYLGVMYYLVI